MRKLFIPLLTVIVVVIIVFVSACSQQKQENPDKFVLVKGGTFINTKSNYYGKSVTIPNFYIGKYEITQKQWVEVMGSNPSVYKGDDLPVESVSWYDCVEYCNNRSIKEGLKPYYNIDKTKKDPNNKNDKDDINWTVMINTGANGYRLPTEAEWEYAAGGGQLSKSYTYSGSDDLDKAAWYWKNSGDKQLSGDWNWTVIENNKNKIKSVGAKKANELGLYDMSGNVREWCWDWYKEGDLTNNMSFRMGDYRGPDSGSARVWKGGGWLGADYCCESSFRGNFEANGKGSDQGFRVCHD
ncbi:MAG: SUMF1/EgtB/PvdO family nonheme iron enzyme [Bacillota bacterium]|nr:SUMF1/EgtB/PvdO family nonheme iron enzyme [Bacillota bacterium]